jgi:hypothetical protein
LSVTKSYLSAEDVDAEARADWDEGVGLEGAELVVEAPDEGLRTLFDAFRPELLYDKAERTVTIRVTVSETTAHALQLPRGTVCVQTEAASGAAQPFPFFVLPPAGAGEVGERRRPRDVGRQLVVTGRFSV